MDSKKFEQHENHPVPSLGAKVERHAEEGHEDAIARGEAAIMAEAENYFIRLRTDIATLQSAIAEVLAETDGKKMAADRVYALLHNTKGQARGFGYGLVTQICALACSILQQNRSPDAGVFRVVHVHIQALSIVIEHNLGGDGGELGQKMVGRLEALGAATGR
jgi:hypothetical protein